MSPAEAEPFPASTDEVSEPFPDFDSQFANISNDSNDLRDFVQPPFAIDDKDSIDLYSNSSPLRPPPARLSLSISPCKSKSPPTDYQRVVFESFPAYEPAIPTPAFAQTQVNSPPPSDASQVDENIVSDVPVRLMSKDNMAHPNAQSKLEPMQYSGAPYANFWDNKRTYKACVNNKSVTGDPFQAALQQNEDQNEHPGKKVKSAVSRLMTALYRKQPSAVVEQQKHDPRWSPRTNYEAAFGHHPTLDQSRGWLPLKNDTKVATATALKSGPRIRALNGDTDTEKSPPRLRSFSFKGVSRTITKQLARPEPDYRPLMLGLTEQEYPIPNRYEILPKDRVSSINNWVNTIAADIPDDERHENFVALTTAELIGIGGADIDGIEIVKKYYAPTNTPIPEQCYSVKGVEDIFDEDEQRPRRKDLIEYLGTRNSGFHLVSMMDIADSTFEDPINLSDYYGIPLIEPDKTYRVAEVEPPVELDEDCSSDDGLYDTTQNIFKSTRRYLPPSHCLILFLHGKGCSLYTILDILSDINPRWLFENQNRCFKTLRVPELADFNDELVDKIKCEYKREREYWEFDGSRDERGRVYPDSWKVLKRIKAERELKGLVERVVENHFWWRCENGVVRHNNMSLRSGRV